MEFDFANIISHCILPKRLSLLQDNKYVLSKTFISLLFFCLFAFSRAAPVAYGGSQARSRIGTVVAGLRQSHSNAGSDQCLQPTPQLISTPDP